MFQSLEVFQIASDMARHAGARQAVTARNVANADTPNYVAERLPSFSETLKVPMRSEMLATRPEHLENTRYSGQTAALYEAMTEPAPNGNSVSLEEEMLNAVSISREHNRALTIYRHSMDVLRMTLGRG